jgi:predicted CXXCH cytochrome family protein
MQEARPETALGDFAGREVRDGGETARFSRRGDRLLVRTEGPDGAPVELEVRYLFGVDPLQQLLLPLPGGRLQALQLAFDTRPRAAGGQRWRHLLPDERARPGDPLHWTGRLFNWNQRCVDCHSTGVRRGYDPATRRYATAFAEIDVSCEACHGPGSRHAAWARGGRTGADPGLPVRFPRDGGRFALAPGAPTARREPPRADTAELDACGPCHARRAVLAEPFEPGGRFEDGHRLALLEEGLYFADGQIRDEVFELGSFLQSRMARAGVVCSDCHEPHAAVLRAEGNALCTSCHRAEVFDAPTHHHHAPASEGAQCVACHMPGRVYMQVDLRRDHSLRVPRPDLAARLGTPEPCTGCHAGRDAAWAAEALRARGGTRGGRWHFADALHAGRTWAAGADAALVRAVRDPEAPAVARATALELLARWPGPEAFAAVQAALVDPDALVRRAAVGWLDAAPPAVRSSLAAPRLRDPVRSVRIEAARVLAGAPAAALGPDPAALEAALEEYRAVQRANADTPEAHVSLGLLAAAGGDAPAAEASFRTALALAPELGAAAVNLADLYRAQGRDGEGERVLRDALARQPDDPGLHHALGLALVRLGRKAEAVAALERAAALGPDEPRYAYVLGVALHDTGERERGLRVLREAAARFPAHRDLAAAASALR